MILIIASDEDVAAVYFCLFLKKNKQKFLFINQKLLGKSFIIQKNCFLYKNNTFFYNKFTGLYLRISSPSIQLQEKNSCLNTYISMLISVMHYKFKNIIGTAISQATNYSKLYQLIISEKVLDTLKTPTSFVIANDSTDRLPIKHNLIYKSLSSIRSIVTMISFENNKHNLLNEPVLFQQILDGHNIRVHVVEQDCFASLMLTRQIDYRYDDSSLIMEYILPENIKKDCLRLNQLLGLKFSGIDLIKVKETFYLLEVNPSPGYSYFDHEEQISKKLSKLLLTG